MSGFAIKSFLPLGERRLRRPIEFELDPIQSISLNLYLSLSLSIHLFGFAKQGGGRGSEAKLKIAKLARSAELCREVALAKPINWVGWAKPNILAIEKRSSYVKGAKVFKRGLFPIIRVDTVYII